MNNVLNYELSFHTNANDYDILGYSANFKGYNIQMRIKKYRKNDVIETKYRIDHNELITKDHNTEQEAMQAIIMHYIK